MGRISDKTVAATIRRLQNAKITRSINGSEQIRLDFAEDLKEARAEITLLGKEVLVYSEYKEAFYNERQIKLERDRYKAALEVVANDDCVTPAIEVAVSALGYEPPECIRCSGIVQDFLCSKCREG